MVNEKLGADGEEKVSGQEGGGVLRGRETVDKGLSHWV